jgi:hypothetical protein
MAWAWCSAWVDGWAAAPPPPGHGAPCRPCCRPAIWLLTGAAVASPHPACCHHLPRPCQAQPAVRLPWQHAERRGLPAQQAARPRPEGPDQATEGSRQAAAQQGRRREPCPVHQDAQGGRWWWSHAAPGWRRGCRMPPPAPAEQAPAGGGAGRRGAGQRHLPAPRSGAGPVRQRVLLLRGCCRGTATPWTPSAGLPMLAAWPRRARTCRYAFSMCTTSMSR